MAGIASALSRVIDACSVPAYPQTMRGLMRLFVVGFTVITLMLVAAVGVSASFGSTSSAHAFNSVVGLFSANNGNDKCPPPKDHHRHISGGDHCDEDDSD